MRKILPIDKEVMLKMNFPLIEEKIDGICALWDGKNIVTKNRIVRNDRFPHLVDALNDINVRVWGEIAVPGGNVYSVMKSENWHKAVFHPFWIEGKNFLLSREIIESLFSNKDKRIRIPRRFSSLNDALDYVETFDAEGIVLKGDNVIFKFKKKKEEKCSVVDVVLVEKKYNFLVKRNNGDVVKIPVHRSSLATKCIKLLEMKKSVICEFEYLYLSEHGTPVQPKVRTIYVL